MKKLIISVLVLLIICATFTSCAAKCYACGKSESEMKSWGGELEWVTIEEPTRIGTTTTKKVQLCTVCAAKYELKRLKELGWGN